MARKDILNIMIFLLSVMLMLFTFAHKKLVDREHAAENISLLPRDIVVTRIVLNDRDLARVAERDTLTTRWQKPRPIEWKACPSTFTAQGLITFFSKTQHEYHYSYQSQANSLIISEKKSSKCVSIDNSFKESLLPN